MDNFHGSYQNSAGSGDVGQMATDFNRLSQTIGSNVQKILQNVSSMQRMIANIGTPQDNQQLQTQLHQIQHYTRQLAQDTSKHIKQLNDYADPGNIATSVPASELRQWKLQRERLTNDFTKALNNFQAAQRSAAQKEKDIVKKAKHSGQGGLQGPTRSGNPLIDMDEGNQNTTETVMRQQQIQEEDYNIEQLEEREKAIRQLESDIVDVNTIFKDLATMVHEQGEIVDSIEANVESTTVRVHEGTDQLRQAELYKNKARKKKVILAAVGVTILVILIAIIAWQAN